MNTNRNYLGEILELLDRASVLSELNPKDKGRYIYLTCPKCGKETAYISKQGYYIHCNRQNNCGYSNGLLDYICDRDKIDETTAISNLANICGVNIPELSEGEAEVFRLQREKQRLLKDILAIGKYGLWKYGGKAVEYLRSRGYEDIEIINMDFGFLPNLVELESHLISQKHSPALLTEVLSSFRNTHCLLIPVFNPSGTIDGFVSRTIDENNKPKYLYSKGLSRGSYFFNFNEAKKSSTLIIVEGIIDALLLTERGISGAVACGGSQPTQDQLSLALTYKNIKNIILCLDNDDAGKAGTEKALEMLKNKNLNLYIADTDLHKDPDEYIKENGVDKFISLLNHSDNSTKWQTNRILEKYYTSSDIDRENTLERLLELHNSIIDPLDCEYILNIIQSVVGYSKESIQKKIELFNEKRNKEKTKDAYKSILQNANKLLFANDFTGINELLNKNLETIKSFDANSIITPYYSIQAKNDIQNRQDGLNTGFVALDQHITIQNGAVTLIAGRPSHGKTTFLLNMFLNMIQQYDNKSFFYFSYEESKTALYIKLINILSGVIINNNNPNQNTQQLEYYIKGNLNSIPEINNSIVNYDKFVQNKRLWLVDEPLDVETLSASIANLKNIYDIGAIYIDYAQRIKYSGKYESERIKIARISEALRETATKLDIPLIVGTQLNRDNAKSKPQLENLKEAGNLEEDANLAIGIYNWKTAISKENAENANGLTNCKAKPINTFDRNIDFEAHILKNRNGSINENALMSFDAPLLKIKEYNPNANLNTMF